MCLQSEIDPLSSPCGVTHLFAPMAPHNGVAPTERPKRHVDQFASGSVLDGH